MENKDVKLELAKISAERGSLLVGFFPAKKCCFDKVFCGTKVYQCWWHLLPKCLPSFQDSIVKTNPSFFQLLLKIHLFFKFIHYFASLMPSSLTLTGAIHSTHPTMSSHSTMRQLCHILAQYPCLNLWDSCQVALPSSVAAAAECPLTTDPCPGTEKPPETCQPPMPPPWGYLLVSKWGEGIRKVPQELHCSSLDLWPPLRPTSTHCWAQRLWITTSTHKYLCWRHQLLLNYIHPCQRFQFQQDPPHSWRHCVPALGGSDSLQGLTPRWFYFCTILVLSSHKYRSSTTVEERSPKALPRNTPEVDPHLFLRQKWIKF